MDSTHVFAFSVGFLLGSFFAVILLYRYVSKIKTGDGTFKVPRGVKYLSISMSGGGGSSSDEDPNQLKLFKRY